MRKRKPGRAERDRQMRERTIKMMLKRGWHFDELESHTGYWHFNHDEGGSIYFATWKNAYDWAKNVVID